MVVDDRYVFIQERELEKVVSDGEFTQRVASEQYLSLTIQPGKPFLGDEGVSSYTSRERSNLRSSTLLWPMRREILNVLNARGLTHCIRSDSAGQSFEAFLFDETYQATNSIRIIVPLFWRFYGITCHPDQENICGRPAFRVPWGSTK